jgi:hypothetical protein
MVAKKASIAGLIVKQLGIGLPVLSRALNLYYEMRRPLETK